MKGRSLSTILAGITLILSPFPAEAFELRKNMVLDCGNGISLFVGDIESISSELTAVHVQMIERANTVAGHLPFAPEALGKCKVLRNPDATNFDSEVFNDGVSEWRAAKGGVFTLPPKEVRQMLKEMIGG